MTKLLPPIEHRFTAGNLPDRSKNRPTPYAQAVAMQQQALSDISDPNCKPSVRAALMRAWDVLEERKRILRGIPLPGQLRPDLDPVQLLKALKRSKARKPIELQPGSGAFAGPMDEEETTDAQTPQAKVKVAKLAKVEASPEPPATMAQGEPTEG